MTLPTTTYIQNTSELHVTTSCGANVAVTWMHVYMYAYEYITVLQAGVDADNILAAAHTLSHADKVQLQDRTLLLLTNQMDRFLASRSVGARRFQFNVKSVLSATCCRICDRRSVTCVTCTLIQLHFLSLHSVIACM